MHALGGRPVIFGAAFFPRASTTACTAAAHSGGQSPLILPAPSIVVSTRTHRS